MCPYDAGKVRFFYEKDTLIENQLCQKILRQKVYGVYCTDTVNLERKSFFTYHNNDTVWFYIDSLFYPIYMFNAQVGDTHILPRLDFVWADTTLTFVVTSIDIEVISGDTLRSYTIETVNDGSMNSKWAVSFTEGLGTKKHAFIPIDTRQMTHGPSWGLICYNDESISFFDSIYNLTCDPCAHAASTAEHSAQKELLIYPNPVYDFLTLKVEGFSINEIEIKDITGKLLVCKRVAHFSDDNKIDVQGLNTGVYLITVRLTNNETITQKFVKN
jgi:hypothetical protein